MRRQARGAGKRGRTVCCVEDPELCGLHHGRGEKCNQEEHDRDGETRRTATGVHSFSSFSSFSSFRFLFVFCVLSDRLFLSSPFSRLPSC